MINIDVSATAFYKSQPVIDFINEIFEQRDFLAKKRGELHDRERLQLTKEIKGKASFKTVINVNIAIVFRH